VDENDLLLVRRGVAAYFRAAAALGSASLLLRQAAAGVASVDSATFDRDEEPDDEFLLDRAQTYQDKALLMSESAVALLRHSTQGFARIEEVEGDPDKFLDAFASEIQRAADATADVGSALEAASFSSFDDYPKLLDELRQSVQFLSAEAAVFAAVAAGELDEPDPADEPGEQLEEAQPVAVVRTGAVSARPAPMFDRTVPDDLIKALSPGEPFGWVAALARRPVTLDEPPLDLGLRASPKQPGDGEATLYLGTTQVLKIQMRRDGKFRLKSHQHGGLFVGIDPPFRPDWNEWQALRALADEGPEIGAHVHAAVAGAPPGRQVEGRYQAALAKPCKHFTLVDREIQLIYVDDQNRRAWESEWRAPLVAMQQQFAERHPWATRGEPPGRKLDALAIALDGRLFAIEVKPGATTKGVAWTPLQVAVYVRMLRSWIGQDHDAAAAVLEGMARQRAMLALTSPSVPKLRRPIEVIPVIAIGKPLTSRREASHRFAAVREALKDAGEPLEGLTLWAVEETGALSALDACDLDDPRFR
jgi:hypothetical protein